MTLILLIDKYQISLNGFAVLKRLHALFFSLPFLVLLNIYPLSLPTYILTVSLVTAELCLQTG